MTDNPLNSDPRVLAIMESERKRADLTDAIQERCIAQMEALGLNSNQVAIMVEGKVSRTQVTDYLGRRCSMGSHKLQHLLDALHLTIKASSPTHSKP